MSLNAVSEMLERLLFRYCLFWRMEKGPRYLIGIFFFFFFFSVSSLFEIILRMNFQDTPSLTLAYQLDANGSYQLDADGW
jgi:hypothetical protein